MSTENDQPDLGPDEDARIRALLADLGSPGASAPLPPEVAVRLDDTLAGLVAEQQAARMPEERRATGAARETSSPLRPRWMPRMAAAAAAIIVLGGAGVAAKTLGPLGGGGGAGSAASDSQAKQAPAEGGGGGNAASGQDDGSDAGSGRSGSGVDGLESAAGVPQLTGAGFATDVRTLLRSDPRLSARTAGDAPSSSAPSTAPSPTNGQTRSPATSDLAASCTGPSVSDASTTTRVSYAGKPAVLVVHPPRGGTRLVEAWACDGRHRLASTTVAP